jgi:hypothetical protein
LKLPSEIQKPGNHRIVIGAREIIEGEGFGASVEVLSPIDVRVPYPGKYLETKLDANSVNVGEPVKFKITLMNYGKDPLDDVRAVITILDPEKKEVETLESTIILIQPDEVKNIELKLDTKDYVAGVYTSILNAYYAGKSTEELSMHFKIGDILIKVLNITNNVINKGEIGKLNITGQSMWNKKIENVYAELEVNPSVKTEALKSSFETFEPWETKNLILYIDSNDFETGTYNAVANIYYSNKTTQESFKLYIKKTA